MFKLRCFEYYNKPKEKRDNIFSVNSKFWNVIYIYYLFIYCSFFALIFVMSNRLNSRTKHVFKACILIMAVINKYIIEHINLKT